MLIALSIFIFFLLGLGFLPLLLLFPDIKEMSRSAAQIIALVFVFGIALDYLLVLILKNLTASLYVGWSLALVGIFLALYIFRRDFLNLFSFRWFIWAVVLYLAWLYSSLILYEPLSAWDARSIWFFHAKLIYYNNGLNLALPSGWDNPSLGFSHVDYPKLLPVLAAQSASLRGYWNEYIPKLGLLILLIPALFATGSFFARPRISIIFLIAVLYFSLGPWLWNGYADGYLALYAALSCLYFGKWLKNEDHLDLLSGVLFLSVVVNLKNEGSFYALTVIFCLFVISTVSGKKMTPMISGQVGWKYILLLLPFLGFFIWNIEKYLWGLQNDLQFGSGSFTRIVERIGQGEIAGIMRALLVDAQVLKAVMLFLIAGVTAKALSRKISAMVLLPAFTAAIYFFGILLVYASTPQDLKWHLATSAGRTMLPVVLCFLASTFFLLEEMEATEINKTVQHKKTAGKRKRRT